MTIEFQTELMKVGESELLVPRFSDEFSLLGTFLYADIQNDGEWFLQLIDKVLIGESELEEITGNICTLKIRKEITKVSDSLSENPEETECDIETEQLKELINSWLRKQELLK